MIPLIDSHLDLAWNAVAFERDLTRSVDEINAAESEYSDSAARGGAVVSLEEMSKGDIWLCFATLLARNAPSKDYPRIGPKRIDLDHRQPWGANCAAHAQLAWYRMMQASGQLRPIGSRSDLSAFWGDRKANRTNAIGMVLVMEGADPITSRDSLVEYHSAGLRQLNLVHYGTNRYAAGTGAKGGLSADGRQLLAWCSELGVALDLTHLADQAFYEAVECFDGPVLASHQNSRALVPGARQFTDDQLRLVIERGGVIGVAFDNWMLVDGWKTGVTPRSAVDLDTVADHIDHLCQLAGSHTIAAIGSDLDGGFGKEQSPTGIDSIAGIQSLAEVLAKRNYPQEAIEAIFHGNWLRWLEHSLPVGEASEATAPEAVVEGAIPIANAQPRIANTSQKLVAVVGAGSIGERHARCFGQTGRASIVLCDVDANRVGEVASRIGTERALTSFEELLALPLDAAVVATPAPFHIPQAKQFVLHGIPVLIEKPLSLSMDDVAELIEVSEQEEVPTSVAYVLRGHSVYSKVRDVVNGGTIGNPLELILQSGQNFPFYRPAYRETYYAHRESGGGAIQDALTHFINLAEWILGPTTSVQADANRLVLQGVSVEDTVHVVARHEDVMATYALNQHQAANETTLTIVGTRGMVRGEVHSNTVRTIHQPDQDWEIQRLPEFDRDYLFMKQANAFLDQIDLGTPAACSLREAAASLATQIAILEASHQAEWSFVERAATTDDRKGVSLSER